MSPVLASRSSIIRTSTSMTSTARMRTTKVLPRYQVSVREGKKSSSTESLVVRRGHEVAQPVAAAQQRADAFAQLGVDVLERADRLAAGDERDAVVHPEDRRREHRERAPQREHRVDPAERGHPLPVLV